MKNPIIIADIIASKYRSKLTKKQLLLEASSMKKLILPELIELGHINPGRIKHIAETYAKLGLLKPGYSLDGLIYNPDPKPDHIGNIINTFAIPCLDGEILATYGLVHPGRMKRHPALHSYPRAWH